MRGEAGSRTLKSIDWRRYYLAYPTCSHSCSSQSSHTSSLEHSLLFARSCHQVYHTFAHNRSYTHGKVLITLPQTSGAFIDDRRGDFCH